MDANPRPKKEAKMAFSIVTDEEMKLAASGQGQTILLKRALPGWPLRLSVPGGAGKRSLEERIPLVIATDLSDNYYDLPEEFACNFIVILWHNTTDGKYYGLSLARYSSILPASWEDDWTRAPAVRVLDCLMTLQAWTRRAPDAGDHQVPTYEPQTPPTPQIFRRAPADGRPPGVRRRTGLHAAGGGTRRQRNLMPSGDSSQLFLIFLSPAPDKFWFVEQTEGNFLIFGNTTRSTVGTPEGLHFLHLLHLLYNPFSTTWHSLTMSE